MAAAAQNVLAFDPVRARISQQVDALDRDFRQISIDDIARRANDLRHFGSAHGFESVCRLAGALNDAVSRDGRAAMIHVYLELLREATWVDPRDKQAAELLMAMVSVRLAS